MRLLLVTHLFASCNILHDALGIPDYTVTSRVGNEEVVHTSVMSHSKQLTQSVRTPGLCSMVPPGSKRTPGWNLNGERDGFHIVSVTGTKTKAEGCLKKLCCWCGTNDTIASAAVLEPGLEFSPKCDSMTPQENPASTPEKSHWPIKESKMNPNCCNQRTENVRKCQGNYESMMIIDLAATPQLPTDPTGPKLSTYPCCWPPTSAEAKTNEWIRCSLYIIIYFGYISDYFFTWILYYYINMNALQSGIASGQLRCY